MELALLVYAISIADMLHKIAVFVIFASFNILFMIFITTSGNEIQAMKKTAIISSTIVGLILLFVPTQKTAWTMVGAYATQRVAESPEMKETSSKVIKIINQKLDSLIDEGQPKK